MENLKKISELTNTLERVEENLNEEKEILEFLLEYSTAGYWDWNIITGYEYLSPKFKSQLGYTVDEMENKPESWITICNEDDFKRSSEKINGCINGEMDEFNETLRFTHKLGDEIKLFCRGKVIKRDENNKGIRMIGTHTLLDE